MRRSTQEVSGKDEKCFKVAPQYKLKWEVYEVLLSPKGVEVLKYSILWKKQIKRIFRLKTLVNEEAFVNCSENADITKLYANS